MTRPTAPQTSSAPEARPVPEARPARPGWDEYFMDIAQQVARRCTCRRRMVGAVLVRDTRILSTGYNGVPAGIEHCLDRGCLREQLGIPSGERHELCRGLHAEQNALLQAARHGISIEGATLYCTAQPCTLCTKMLINAGIVDVVFRDAYPDSLAVELLKEAGVPTRMFGQQAEERTCR